MVLLLSPGRHDDVPRRDPGLCEAREQRRQMQPGDNGVGDDDRAPLRQHRAEQRPGAGQQSIADHHLVARAGQRDRKPVRRAIAKDRIHHPHGRALQSLIAAVNDHVGLGIDRVAHRRQPLQDFRRVSPGQQRPMVAPGDPACQHRQRAAQPHRCPDLPHCRARARVHERAPAEGQHHRPAREKPANDPPLAVAEGLLAIAREQLGDGAAGGGLDLHIGIAERQAEPSREPAPDRGLAGTHQPYQHNGSLDDRFVRSRPLLHGDVACHDPKR